MTKDKPVVPNDAATAFMQTLRGLVGTRKSDVEAQDKKNKRHKKRLRKS